MNKPKVLGLSNALLKYYAFKKRTPLSVTIHLNDRCNYSCSYCSIWKKHRKELTTAQVFSLLDGLKKLGTQRVGFTGGEPLLRGDIGKIIDHAHQLGIITTLVTNGALVEKKINELKNLDILAPSLQGPEEVHDKQIRKGAYKNIIKAIKIAREHGIKVWNVVVLTKYNIDHVDFLLKKAEEMDFYLHFQPVFAYPLSGDVKDVMPILDKYRAVIKKLIEEKKRPGNRINSSIACLKYHYNYPNYGKLKCYAGELYIWVDVDGKVYPCFGMIGRINAPSVLDVGVKNAVNKTVRLACHGCFCHAYVEMNNMCSLNFGEIFNMAKIMQRQ